MIDLSQKTIVVCSIVRDAEPGLKRNIPVIKDFLRRFKSYDVIIFENDSKDRTKSLLENWYQEDPSRIHISAENTDPSSTIPSAKQVSGVNPFFSNRRISKMARLRNQYMEYIDKYKLVADYLMVVDLDVCQLYENALVSTFMRDDWDAVCANGYSLSPKLKRRYHDTYALYEYGTDELPKTEDNILNVLPEKYGSLSSNDDWIRVDSGFGGVAIYRFEAASGLRYVALPNNDARVDVCCEHLSIYKQMKARGFNRFYLNPGMYLKYQRVTLKIIYNSIKRILVK